MNQLCDDFLLLRQALQHGAQIGNRAMAVAVFRLVSQRAELRKALILASVECFRLSQRRPELHVPRA